jgi:membrane-bound metal-dependent hydrolase YbcI (DUF457 family)
MPSPFAHSAVGFVLWPLLPRDRVARLQRWKRVALVGGVLVGLNGPDIDIAYGLAMGDAFAWHAGPTHSLLAGAIFASAFAPLFRAVTGLPCLHLWLIGCAAWWSHVLLDACTGGAGVPLLWPFTGDTFTLPVPLFYGVRHSQPWAFDHHAITLLTELPFAALMFLVGRWLGFGGVARRPHARALTRAAEIGS